MMSGMEAMTKPANMGPQFSRPPYWLLKLTIPTEMVHLRPSGMVTNGQTTSGR